MLIFLHLPKSAGSTLGRIIRRQYPGDRIYPVYSNPPEEAIFRFEGFSAERRAEFDVVMGHVHLGMHELVPRPSTYVTLLRDPVERVISSYYFVLRKPDHPAHERIEKDGMSLADVLRAGVLPYLDNGQTRILYGLGHEDVPYGESPPEMLDRARENLDRYFAVVGTTDRFDETLLLMQQRFDWGHVLYRRRNVTPRRPEREALDPETLRLIRRHNELDIELYRYADQRLRENMRAQGPLFQRRVEIFRALNRTLNGCARLKAAVRGMLARAGTDGEPS